MKFRKFVFWTLVVITVLFIFCTMTGVLTPEESRAVIVKVTRAIVAAFEWLVGSIQKAYAWAENLFKEVRA